MNKSIRYKLLAYMTVSIAIFAVLLYGANSFFAEKYYTMNKKGTLIKSTKAIKEIIKSVDDVSELQDENLVYNLNKIERSVGCSIYIGSMDGYIYYPVAHSFKELPRKGLLTSPFFTRYTAYELYEGEINKIKRWNNENVVIEPYNQKSFFIVTKDPNLKIETLRLQTTLDNGLLVSVWVPIAEISESAALSNRLTAIIAIITMIITCGWAFYISDKFTKPITEMNTITKRMTNLDFSQKIEIDGEDEIGQLSKSINNLSSSLDSAIGELNSKNLQLEKDIDKGKKIDMLRREFVSNVSHELKTPIFLIQGYAEGLKVNVANDEEKRNFYCDVIMEESGKMDLIVRDLLNLSQLESGTLILDKSSFDIKQMTRNVVKKLEPVFEEKGVKAQYNFNGYKIVEGDVFRIEQVLTNYLNNAVNHVDENKVIRLTVNNHENKIRVAVYNSGRHIPEENMDRIWSSFYKIDKARTREYGGTGLGLTIVKAIMEAHNNSYGVNNVEAGVEFWFDLDSKD